MSLDSNIAGIAFDTEHAIDKIVGVWEGSFDRTTQVISRTYTFAGSPYTVYFYRIAHGLMRPIFIDLLWSTDNVTFVDGGIGTSGISGDQSIAFSDSTYIYIYSSQGSVVAGTMYYKAIGFWIDDYDTTNPSVASYLSTNNAINFDSRVNYQKIYDHNVSNFSFTSGVFSESTNTIHHGLNHRVNFRVFFEAQIGEVWPMNSGGNSNIFVFDDNQLECYARMVDDDLLISQIHYGTSTRTSGRAWYRIYMDA